MVNKAFAEGIKMDYAVFGRGEKILVILPGLSVRNVTADYKALEQKFKMFANEYTVYVFDRRDNIGERYSVDEMAEDTVRIMKRLGIKKANIFGVSQGGMMAMCIAAGHPELVERMVLGSTAAAISEGAVSVCDGWIKAAREGRRADLAELFMRAVYSESTANIYRSGFLTFAETYTEEELRRFVVLAESIRSFNVFDRLGCITAPTLVIGCKGDKGVGAQASLDIAEKMGCEVYLYDNTYGHGVYDEAPDYCERIFDFFQGGPDC